MSIYTLLHSFVSTRMAMKKNPVSLDRHHKRLWRKLQPSIAITPALAHLADKPLRNFPITAATEIRNDFAHWNSFGISDQQAHIAAQDAELGGDGYITSDIVAGYSTGTSGQRGVFLASAREGQIYLGQTIAKLLPLRAVIGGARIALFLRANSRLYSTIGGLSRFRFKHYSLSLSAEQKYAEIKRFQPTILIAPSHVLVELAELALAKGEKMTSLERCFYGAEPMGDHERAWIEESLGIRPDPIYQATEGFLAAPCSFGTLHLNEESLNVELVPVDGTTGFQPVVTDLLRKTQPIVRVRLDDFIELDNRICACGFSGRSIRPVAGRVPDLWHFNQRIITPREVTNILEKTLGCNKKWVAVGSPNRVKLHLEASISNDQALDVAKKLTQGLQLECLVEIASLDDLNAEPKRRRVRWEACNG